MLFVCLFVVPSADGVTATGVCTGAGEFGADAEPLALMFTALFFCANRARLRASMSCV